EIERPPEGATFQYRIKSRKEPHERRSEQQLHGHDATRSDGALIAPPACGCCPISWLCSDRQRSSWSVRVGFAGTGMRHFTLKAFKVVAWQERRKNKSSEGLQPVAQRWPRER